MADLKHEVSVDIKRVAVELGRTPSRREYLPLGRFTQGQIEAIFGSWGIAIKACGLEPVQRKINNSIFEVSIEDHINKYIPEKWLGHNGPYPTAAIISDIHWPFHHQKVIDRFYEYVGDEKPEWVITNGDDEDYLSHGRFPRSHNIFTPEEERQLTKKLRQEFWDNIKKRSQNSKKISTTGNHNLRPLKQALSQYPEAENWIKEGIERDRHVEGVKTIFDHREELYISPDIIVFHGYRSGLGDHRDYTNMSCVVGHTHVGGVTWRRYKGKNLFELNSGYAGDPEAKGLTYTPQKITKWTWGFGAINKNGPQFISL